jgi:hypothetical protein
MQMGNLMGNFAIFYWLSHIQREGATQGLMEEIKRTCQLFLKVFLDEFADFRDWEG